MIHKLVFKTEEDMLKALVGCKFAEIECKTEYCDEEVVGIDLLSFEMER